MKIKLIYNLLDRILEAHNMSQDMLGIDLKSYYTDNNKVEDNPYDITPSLLTDSYKKYLPDYSSNKEEDNPYEYYSCLSYEELKKKISPTYSLLYEDENKSSPYDFSTNSVAGGYPIYKSPIDILESSSQTLLINTAVHSIGGDITKNGLSNIGESTVRSAVDVSSPVHSVIQGGMTGVATSAVKFMMNEPSTPKNDLAFDLGIGSIMALGFGGPIAFFGYIGFSFLKYFIRNK
ncbi:MAG: hypothetical protein PHU95_04325 [Candidatus Thermoplasmatota archaeon]|nr:hypothetical protein [Candidatus Thermoplasmatota archaeon]MDD5778654.1 hypothetical protein [Candidatus Thermoplasmatota archaeon]